MSKLLDHVHLSPRFRYVYVDTPKVACSTIKRALQSAERGYAVDGGEASGGKFGYSETLLTVHDRSKSPLRRPSNRWALRWALARASVSFCFVRNPYARVLSAYLDKIATNENRREIFLRGLVEDPREPISFAQFLDVVSGQTPDTMNAHWRPQCYHNMIDSIGYDFIGAFETLNSDLLEILKIATPSAISFVSAVDEHRTSAMEYLKQYYEFESSVRSVQSIYKRDFEVFGYSIDLNKSSDRPAYAGFSSRRFLKSMS
nr:sulfotransferase family protein [Aminobacter aganoensis]